MLNLATHRQPMLQSIATLLEALHSNDILYCTLKGNDQHLKNALTGESDFDVLFDANQKVKLETILSTLGFKEFIAIRPKRFKDIYDFFTLDPASGKVLHLHTYYAFTVGEPFLKGYQPDIAGHILRNRRYHPDFGLYCIPPALELTLLYLTETLKLRRRDLLRHFLKNNTTFSEKVTYEYKWLKEQTTTDDIIGAIHATFTNHQVISKLVQSEFDQNTIRYLAPRIRKEFAPYRLYSPLIGLWLRWQRELSIKIRRQLAQLFELPVLRMRVSPRGGLIVSIVDDNPASAAMIINAIKETFARKLDVFPISFRRGVMRAVTASDRGKYSLGRYLGVIFRELMTWEKLRRMKSAKKNGALVICDEPPIDTNRAGNQTRRILSLLSHSTNPTLRYLATWEGKIYSRLKMTFSPDLIFRFNGTGLLDKFQGAGHNPHSDIDRDIAAAKKLGIPNNARTVDIDPEKSLNEKLSILRHEIWRQL